MPPAFAARANNNSNNETNADRRLDAASKWVGHVLSGVALAAVCALALFLVETKVRIAELQKENEANHTAAAIQWQAVVELKAEIKADLKAFGDKLDDVRDRLPPKYSNRNELRKEASDTQAVVR